MLNIPNPTA